MGKTLLAAILAAVVASIATTLVMQSIADDRARVLEARVDDAEQRAADAEERVLTALDRVDRFGDRVQRTEIAVNEAQQNALSAVRAAGAEPAVGAEGLKAPDGTPYVSRAELETALAERPATFEFEPPPPAKTLEEIAEEMGLTAHQESTLRVILRDAEQEMINMLFGNRPIEDVIADARRAQEDPDLQAEMVQGVIMRGVGNAGKIMTWENRVRKKVTDALGEEKGSEFLGKPRKPVLDASLEEVFEGIFR